MTRRERELFKQLMSRPLNVVRKCLYPLWDDEGPVTHQYCGGRTKEGSSYCEAHHAVCWKPLENKHTRKRVTLERLAMLP